MSTPHSKFLYALFGDVPDDLFILIWTLPDKKSYWAKHVPHAVAIVQTLIEEKLDVYVGLGLSPEDLGAHGRCKEESIAAVTSLWADIDFQGPGHKKKNLPPDLSAAKKVLGAIGPAPSIIVHSGHGLQCYWRFKEPWILDDTTRPKAISLSRRWNQHVKDTAKEVGGWEIDSTFDLARVFRVPGTLNRKDADHLVPVRILAMDDSRTLDYSQEDLTELLPDPAPAHPQEGDQPIRDVPDATFTLKPGASPPFDKFGALAAAEPRFKASWDRTRKDMADTSPSAWDFSLASFAYLARWTDQEVVDLLVANRRRHGDDLKLRDSYYKLTLDKAKKTVKVDHSDEILNEIEAIPETDVRKQKTLEFLSDVFDVPIMKIIKFTARIPSYRLETGNGNIHLGQVENLITQPKLRNALAAAAGKFIPFFKPGKWMKIAQAALDVCVDQDVGEESTDEGVVEYWMDSYLGTKTPIEDLDAAVETKYPFIKDDEDGDQHTYFFLTDLRKHLNLHESEKISMRDIGAQLRTCGYAKVVLNLKVKGAWTTRKVWTSVTEGN